MKNLVFVKFLIKVRLSFSWAASQFSPSKVAITSHRKVPDIARVGPSRRPSVFSCKLFARRTYGRVLSRTTSLFSCMKETPRNTRERENTLPTILDALRSPKLIALTENCRAKQLRGTRSGYRQRYNLIEELAPSPQRFRLIKELTNKGEIANGPQSFQSNGIDGMGSRRLPWLACHVRAIENY